MAQTFSPLKLDAAKALLSNRGCYTQQILVVSNNMQNNPFYLNYI